MGTLFKNRDDAGRQLATAIKTQRPDLATEANDPQNPNSNKHNPTNPIVLGLARGGVPVAAQVAKALNLANRTVILVDDGMATGATMLAAAAFAKSQNAAEIVVALPVAPIDAPEIFGGIANLICPHIRTDLAAVGQYYEVFDQVEDASVRQHLAAS